MSFISLRIQSTLFAHFLESNAAGNLLVKLHEKGLLMLLAQEGGGDGAAGGVNPMAVFLPYVLIGLLAYFLFVVPSRNKQQRFQKMLDGLKENDHVVTTGGIHGVVTNVNREQLKLTLRVDESSGAKLKVSFWAIDSIEADTREPSATNKS